MLQDRTSLGHSVPFVVEGETKSKIGTVVRMRSEVHSNLLVEKFCSSDQFVPLVKFCIIEISIPLQLFSIILTSPRIEFSSIVPTSRIEFSINYVIFPCQKLSSLIILHLRRIKPRLRISQQNILLRYSSL